MTLGECIQRADALRPNAYSEDEKARWVLELERELETVFFPRYQDGAPAAGPRRWPEDRAKPLLASGPFEEMYLYALVAKMELMDQEWDGYNVHNAMAAQLQSDFKKEWHRTHRLKPGGAVVL